MQMSKREKDVGLTSVIKVIEFKKEGGVDHGIQK